MLRVLPSQTLPIKENVEITTQSKELKTQLINLMVPLKELKLEFHINQPFSKLKKNSLIMQVLLSVKVIPKVLLSQTLLIKKNVEITTQLPELKIQLTNSMPQPKKLKLEFLINQPFSKLKKNSLIMQVLLLVKVIPKVLLSQTLLIKENVETTIQLKELKIQLINSMLPQKKLKPEFLINQLYFNQPQRNLPIQTQSIL